VKHEFWTILVLGTGVKSPAKLIATEERRIMAAALSFMCASTENIAASKIACGRFLPG
jgi:hypothetical protein